jgi:hypothetical protein
MKIPRFASEYDSADVPELVDHTMLNTTLFGKLADLAFYERLETAQQNLILRAVSNFYLAKYFDQAVLRTEFDKSESRLKSVVLQISDGLNMQAVVSVATTVDTVSGRTASLPHLLVRVRKELEDSTADTAQQLDRVDEIAASANPDLYRPLKYVTHLRNKWAAHSSFDLHFDDWSMDVTEKTLSWPLIEAALVRVVNAFDDYAELEESSAELREAAARPQQVPTTDDAGHKVFRATVKWSNVRVLAQAAREIAEKDSAVLFETLVRGSDVPPSELPRPS